MDGDHPSLSSKFWPVVFGKWLHYEDRIWERFQSFRQDFYLWKTNKTYHWRRRSNMEHDHFCQDFIFKFQTKWINVYKKWELLYRCQSGQSEEYKTYVHKRWKQYTDQRECDTLERIQRVQEGVTEDVAWRYATDKVRMINEQNFSVLKVPFQKIKTASKLH